MLYEVITRPYPNINGGLTKPPLELEHGCVIKSLFYVDVIAYACLKLGVCLAKLYQ